MVPDFGAMSPKEFRKSLTYKSTTKKIDPGPMFIGYNTTDKKRDSDQYSFGGASDPDDREPLDNWQQLLNQREELRMSIMSIKNPKI